MFQINISIPFVRNSHTFEDSGLENFESFASVPYFIYDFLLAEKVKFKSPMGIPITFLRRILQG